MNKKKFYNKPIAKVVKIDCVYLADISGYGPGGSGGGEGGNEQVGPEVPGTES